MRLDEKARYYSGHYGMIQFVSWKKACERKASGELREDNNLRKKVVEGETDSSAGCSVKEVKCDIGGKVEGAIVRKVPGGKMDMGECQLMEERIFKIVQECEGIDVLNGIDNSDEFV